MYTYLTTLPEKGNEATYCSEYIDVRDVADAFVAALRIDEAGGERFILDAGNALSFSCVETSTLTFL